MTIPTLRCAGLALLTGTWLVAASAGSAELEQRLHHDLAAPGPCASALDPAARSLEAGGGAGEDMCIAAPGGAGAGPGGGVAAREAPLGSDSRATDPTQITRTPDVAAPGAGASSGGLAGDGPTDPSPTAGAGGTPGGPVTTAGTGGTPGGPTPTSGASGTSGGPTPTSGASGTSGGPVTTGGTPGGPTPTSGAGGTPGGPTPTSGAGGTPGGPTPTTGAGGTSGGPVTTAGTGVTPADPTAAGGAGDPTPVASGPSKSRPQEGKGVYIGRRKPDGRGAWRRKWTWRGWRRPVSLAKALEGAAGPAEKRLRPGDVALAPPGAISLAPPSAPGPRSQGACDTPGSGCMGALQPAPTPSPARPRPAAPTFVLPPPVSGCGGPGFPCP